MSKVNSVSRSDHKAQQIRLAQKLIVKYLEGRTQEGKIKWFKLYMSPNDYHYEARYKDRIRFRISPSQFRLSWNVGVETLDSFGNLTHDQQSFLWAEIDGLVAIIESTNPRLGDAVHNDFFAADRRSVLEKALADLI